VFAAASYHFPTKNDLLHALADPLLDELDSLVERHPGSSTDGTAAVARAMAALGPLWRPLQALTAAELAAHREALIHAAMAGCETSAPATWPCAARRTAVLRTGR